MVIQEGKEHEGGNRGSEFNSICKNSNPRNYFVDVSCNVIHSHPYHFYIYHSKLSTSYRDLKKSRKFQQLIFAGSCDIALFFWFANG